MKRVLPVLLLLAALTIPAFAGVMETDGAPSAQPTPSPTPEVQAPTAVQQPDPLLDGALSLIQLVLSLL